MVETLSLFISLFLSVFFFFGHSVTPFSIVYFPFYEMYKMYKEMLFQTSWKSNFPYVFEFNCTIKILIIKKKNYPSDRFCGPGSHMFYFIIFSG